MKFQNGWIKIHRKIMASDSVQDNHKVNTSRLGLWIYILMNCNIYESKIKHGNKEVTIPPGAMAFSYQSISDAVDLSYGQTRRFLNYLHKTERIDIKSSNQGSYLIVNKWEEYQVVIEDKRRVVTDEVTDEQTTSEQPIDNQQTQTREVKKKRKKKRKTSKKSVVPKLVNLDFLDGELTDFISGVSDEIRMRWLSRYCNQTISDHLLKAKDWSLSKGKTPRNVASLMNTFFSDTPHDKWKDTDGGVDPDEKALSDEFNLLLEEGKQRIEGNA